MSKSLISIQDFSKDEILHIIEIAKEFEANPVQDFLKGKIVASLFFEASTRTRLSFEAAIHRLGASVIGFSDVNNTSQSKGESLEDTIRIVSNYVDLIVMRHPQAGAANIAQSISHLPIINAGDGANQHPTQTLLDIYSIEKTQGRLDNLCINMVGDLKYGRTVHSLSQALSLFDNNFIFTSPKELQMPYEYKEFLEKKNKKYLESQNLQEHINDCDILYMTRIQQERFASPEEYNKVKDIYILEASMLKNAKDSMRILHPLPRVNEIAKDVDKCKQAYYFEQAGNGMYIRMAVIAYLLGYR